MNCPGGRAKWRKGGRRRCSVFVRSSITRNGFGIDENWRGQKLTRVVDTLLHRRSCLVNALVNVGGLALFTAERPASSLGSLLRTCGGGFPSVSSF